MKNAITYNTTAFISCILELHCVEALLRMFLSSRSRSGSGVDCW